MNRTRSIRSRVAGAGILWLMAVSILAGDRSVFRGPHGDSIAKEEKAPLHCSNSKPSVCVSWSDQFPIVAKDHLWRRACLQRDLSDILNSSQSVRNERMAQGILLPFDSAVLCQPLELLRNIGKRNDWPLGLSIGQQPFFLGWAEPAQFSGWPSWLWLL